VLLLTRGESDLATDFWTVPTTVLSPGSLLLGSQSEVDFAN